MQNKFVRYGGIGTVLAALCCVTPILVVALTAVGAAAVVGYLDYVLFPLLAFFIGLIVYGWYRGSPPQACGDAAHPATTEKQV